MTAPDGRGADIDRLSVWAVRYALGRSTYAVGDVVDVLARNAAEIKPYTRWVICGDIDMAIAAGQVGMDMDREQWLRLRAALGGDR